MQILKHEKQLNSTSIDFYSGKIDVAQQIDEKLYDSRVKRQHVIIPVLVTAYEVP